VTATGTAYVKTGEFVTRAIAGELIVVPITAGVGDLDSIYTLNEVGAAIWELIDGTTSVEGIVAAVAREFEVGNDLAKADVLEFVTSLAEAGLIRPVPEGQV
jgi:Coenzyme PQQ synthesis protein D (PqqD)